ncbi:hypothetical protein [uncultured Methanobrevibacter sp.]|uniref:hypothetical protein n=1 Tax=uncultured Methanobrevibacter sp. TaxID=253161 RepID=UPI0025FDB369|nr:hypothetical protein [uncultured Methanobrevibacter sp.]
MSIKEIKSIELASYTVITTSIGIVFSIIAAIALMIPISMSSPEGINIAIYILPTIVVGTLIYETYRNFFEGFIFNALSKRLKKIKFVLNDESEIVQVSTTEPAIITSIILTIEIILLYLVLVMLLPILVTSFIQTLMFTGQQALAYNLYQFLMILSQPTTILMIIFGTFIITFVFTLLATYIYNILAKSGRGIVVELSDENNLTVLESINTLKFAIAFAVVSGVLNIILAIIMMISGGQPTAALGNIIGGFISGFVLGALISIFYNVLSPKLGKLKLELIDR